MEMLGIDTPRLAQMTRLPESVITRALTGQPISSAHADKIAQHLSFGHGFNGNNNRLHHSDIEALNVVDPETLRKK